jgi:LacI family transcriptional regulator
VSISTASRVLNAQPFVKNEVRERVLAASKVLGYRPDLAARTMRTGTSGAVGFVVSDIANPMFATIAKAADSALSPHGYALFVANSANDPVHETELIATLRQRRLDGLIVAAADERTPGLAEQMSAFPAAVLLDRDVPGARSDAVLSDHALGIGAAVRHLFRLGHRRIAIVAGSRGQRASLTRLDAYRATLLELGLSYDELLVRAGELSPKTGDLAARQLLGARRPPTAIIAGNNQLFTGVLSAVRALGIKVPAAVSLVACDETDLTALHDPPFDVVGRDLAELGRTAAQLLLARLQSPERPPTRLVLPTWFEARGSSAPSGGLGTKGRIEP